MYGTELVQGVAIDRFAWLEGRWLDERNDVRMEEFWSGPGAGTMVGMFRWTQADDLRFYEIIVLEELDGGLVMRIKHFNRGLDSWEEEHMRFDLVVLEDRRAIFFLPEAERQTWLIYEHEENGDLRVYFAYQEEEAGNSPEFRFVKQAS